MRHRTTSEITIRRPISGGGQQESVLVAAVPITANSKRKFTLMGEDSITLSFTLATATRLVIGDFIDDELFGRFFLTKEYLPKFNTTTGGYDYDITFEAEYLLLRNHIFMLTTTSSGNRVRKETSWRLTGNLAAHANEVLHNAQVLGIGITAVDITAEKAAETRYLQYSAVDIITALGMIADAFECEWWVSDGTLHLGKCEEATETLEVYTADIVVYELYEGPPAVLAAIETGLDSYFDGWRDNAIDLAAYNALANGITSGGASRVTMSTAMFNALNSVFTDLDSEGVATIGTANGESRTIEVDNSLHFRLVHDTEHGLTQNVESMDIQDNRSTYANRIYAYGGTRNVPHTYDRELVFTLDTINDTDSPNYNTYEDSTRKLSPLMISGEDGETMLSFGNAGTAFTVTGNNTTSVSLVASTGQFSVGAAGALLSGDIHARVLFNISSGVQSVCTLALYSAGSPVRTLATNTITQQSPQTNFDHSLYEELASGIYQLKLTITLTHQSGNITVSSHSVASESLKVTKHGVTAQGKLTFNGVEHDITFNPTAADNTTDKAGRFMFGTPTSPASEPSGFGVGSQYTLSPLTIKVPASYYTLADYDDPSALAKIGEKRIHLPKTSCPYQYIEKEDLDNSNIVESAVVFEKAFPRLTLVITEIKTETRVQKDELEDGSPLKWPWLKYFFKVQNANGTSFDFDTDYILDDNKLQALFVTRQEEIDATASGHACQGAYKLAGMTFDVSYDNSTKWYGIVRNEDYGTMLPSALLAPEVGDALVLTGWNPMALQELGLVAAAEAEVKTLADEYLDALEEGQFTFTCHMMSDWPFTFIEDIPLHTSADEPVEVTDNGGKWLYVRNDFNAYRLPIEGARVTIHHDALNNGSKVSRVIGYEFKLDMPWDSPTYTIGETQAYSRLAKIEKEITKLS